MSPGVFTGDMYTRRWKKVQQLADTFWRRWKSEYLPLLQTRQKWTTKRKNVEPGDVVLMIEEALPRGQWPLGRVDSVIRDHKGLVRQVIVRRGGTQLRRPISKLVKIVES